MKPKIHYDGMKGAYSISLNGKVISSGLNQFEASDLYRSFLPPKTDQRETVIALYDSAQAVVDEGFALTRLSGQSVARDESTAATGNYGQALARDNSRLEGGQMSQLVGQIDCSFRGGMGSVFVGLGGTNHSYVTAIVGENGIEPNIWYTIVKGKFVKI